MTTKTSEKRPNRVNRLKDMKVNSDGGPVLDGMTPEEKELFLAVVRGCVESIHRTHPIQQASNMEVFYASTCRSSLFYAGLYVRELRRLKEEFEG